MKAEIKGDMEAAKNIAVPLESSEQSDSDDQDILEVWI